MGYFINFKTDKMKNVLKVMAIAIVLFLSVEGKVNAQTETAAKPAVPVVTAVPIKKVAPAVEKAPVSVVKPVAHVAPVAQVNAAAPVGEVTPAAIVKPVAEATTEPTSVQPATVSKIAALNLMQSTTPAKPVDVNSQGYKLSHQTIPKNMDDSVATPK